MTDAQTSSSTGSSTSSSSSSSASSGADNSALDSEHGTTTIADGVVSKIAGIATREVGGVHALGGGASRALGSVTQAVGLGDDRSQGVSVEVGEKQAAIDLVIVVEYGESIPQIAEAVRTNVGKRIEAITGLSVTEINIAVNDLHFAGDDESDETESRVQ